MKNNKGFAPIAIILIIIAALAVGGVAYYMRKSSSIPSQNAPVNNYQPPVNQNGTTSTVSNLQLTSGDNGKTFIVAKEETIAITLCNPGDGGYQFDTPQYNSSILQLTGHKNIPLNNPPGYVGGCYGNDVFDFQALNIGTSKLNITASRGTAGTINMFSATIVVQGAQGGIKSNTCTPKWVCGWGPCIIPPCAPGSSSVACANGTQSQVVIDSNNCGLPSSNINIACPALARICK